MVTASLVQNYQVRIQSGSHVIIADEPIDHNGTDLGTDPYGLLMSSLAACKVMTVKMYAARKEWPLEGMDIKVTYQRVKARDCDECVSEKGNVDIFDCEMKFHGDFTPEQLERLREISGKCPVHRSLLSETIIHSTLAE